ncbi:aldo/keto reductase [Lederbergia wuyishanensis]|uniref:Aryl-alcohol dehydrogenase-like predicted oxidoreductase n=1 Tax=Lederbergia wuyishanensis TaxID=1347903 RepID=A0ABU0D924_9BACI|nr:aldo/keto reductase [Lederbergia wuyishanensis]MCJ8007540.1 aldo/keto reductase [Lederbergia wuyishanensis]MDQ0344880.1 aryl-alcohol dehydrogenase-like predicted oxidoreductase [Lederbergia wuyishanensis]
MEYRTLGETGLSVSALSFGASSLGSVFRNIYETEGIKTVHTAIDLGVNLIDVSPYYGLTRAETVLGKALKTVSRDKYYLCTKAGRYGENDFNFSHERIIKSVDESLQRLHADYLDILLLHDIEFGDRSQIVNEGIPALHDLKKEGKIRFFGVSGLPLSIFTDMVKQTNLDVILSYCHFTINDTSLEDILPLMSKTKTGVINASPLGMGLLSQRGAPEWHPASERIKSVCQKAVDFCNLQGVPIEKLAVQFSVNNKSIPTTLISTANPKNVKNNIRWVEEPMDEGLLTEVQKILEPIHNETW